MEAPDSLSLAKLYGQCVSGFQHLLSRLQDAAHHDLQDKAVSLDAALEAHGKLRIWAEQTRVFLPPSSRGSLDELVRDRAKTKRILISALKQLANLLHRGEHCNSLTTTTTTRNDFTTPASDDRLKRDGSVNDPSQTPQSTRLSLAMRYTLEQIYLLYNASALLKRPGLTGRYVRSKNSISDDVKSVQEYFQFDKAYVQEKLLQWHDDWAVQNQEGYRGRISSSTANIDVKEDLVLRLTMANLKRRRQLRYWLHHADVPETASALAEFEPGVQSRTSTLPPVVDNAVVSTAQDFHNGTSEAAHTTKSTVSFSTAVVTEVNDLHEQVAEQTEYEESAVGSSKSTPVPPLPQDGFKSARFDCPYSASSAVSIHYSETDDQEVYEIIRNSGVTEESPVNLPAPAEDVQDWRQVFAVTQKPDKSGEYDPTLAKLQKMQSQLNGFESSIRLAAGIGSKEAVVEFQDRTSLQNFMDDHMAILTFEGVEQQFLPRVAFERATTRAVILQALDDEKFTSVPKAFFELGSFQELNELWTIPIHFDNPDPIWKGYWSEIYTVRIHSEQHSWLPKDETYLMRVYRFKEQYNLDVVPFVLQLRMAHVVHCLAAFTLSSSVYMIYGTMYGNLEQYISSNLGRHIDDRVLLSQLSGIAGALHNLHNGTLSRDARSNESTNPFMPFTLDITPEKIMVFSEQIFGLQLWVESFQILRRGNPGKVVLTPAYKAPESLRLSEAASVTRANIWSLGCTYLEIIVWYVDGYTSLCIFRESRGLAATRSNKPTDKGFWYLEGIENDAKARLREPVNVMLLSLLARTKGPIHRAVDLIQDMLQIDPEKRPSADFVAAMLSSYK
ncbi:protein kinase domain-containing protein [Stagonosporopsis vannaccii]|nr:protein kinase domain-containing protein [Stagonosporopsis vannaccii]